MFDPQSFLDAQMETPLEKRPPLPEGDYTAMIGEIKSRAWQGKADPSKSGIAWDIALVVQIPMDLQDSLGRPELTITDSTFIDITESGMIDSGPGKNRKLRAYREALDMNKVGDVFSARKMTGGIVKVKVKHDIYEGEPQERISGVAKA